MNINRRKVIDSQKQSVFWPTLYNAEIYVFYDTLVLGARMVLTNDNTITCVMCNKLLTLF